MYADNLVVRQMQIFPEISPEMVFAECSQLKNSHISRTKCFANPAFPDKIC